ncbi:MAG: hypothetical protein II844_08730 [Prevotella sp.]|nr:hypothetical protein [Prevotella sp.]MBR6191620.1 hypothetical protein [Prevotella sp.]
MGIFSLFKKKDNEAVKIGGMQDYMMLIRVYFQAAIATQIGITNIAMLPDLRVFKSTFKVHTEHNKLGLAEKGVCRKMLKNMYGHDDLFFKEIDRSISRNCRKIQDVQTYLYQFQGFTQDMMMLTSNLMKFKLRLPSFFKKAIYAMTEKTVGEIFTKNDYTDAATLKAVASVRKYNQKLNFSQEWVTNFVYQVVMLAKKEKLPKDNK